MKVLKADIKTGWERIIVNFFTCQSGFMNKSFQQITPYIKIWQAVPYSKPIWTLLLYTSDTQIIITYKWCMWSHHVITHSPHHRNTCSCFLLLQGKAENTQASPPYKNLRRIHTYVSYQAYSNSLSILLSGSHMH